VIRRTNDRRVGGRISALQLRPALQPKIRFVTTPSGLTRSKSAGHGSPTVVFVGGAGEGLRVWNDIVPAVAAFTRALAYDRLGLGHSADTQAPRDSAQIALELEQLLGALKEEKPVLLVSHSAGAFHARMFARRYPERVAALLFVEPSHEDWLSQLRDFDPKSWRNHLRWRQQARHSPGRKRELAAWDAIVAQMRELGPALPDVPVTIISATAGHSAATDVLGRLHQCWLAELPHAQHIVTDASGHQVQKDAPLIVVRAVQEMVKALQSAADRTLEHAG
jgi:pimeloyl-ACP methyl ester carboxylesterase